MLRSEVGGHSGRVTAQGVTVCQPLPTRPGPGRAGGAVTPGSVTPGSVLTEPIFRLSPRARERSRGLRGHSAEAGVPLRRGQLRTGVPGAQSATVLTWDSWEQAGTSFILKAILRGGTKIPFYTRGN